LFAAVSPYSSDAVTSRAECFASCRASPFINEVAKEDDADLLEAIITNAADNRAVPTTPAATLIPVVLHHKKQQPTKLKTKTTLVDAPSSTLKAHSCPDAHHPPNNRWASQAPRHPPGDSWRSSSLLDKDNYINYC
jgi:hypothetical protein